MDDIIKLLDLEDENVFVSDVQIAFNTKYITVESRLTEHHCPQCGYRMHSKGIRHRTVRHPVLQDGYKIVIDLKERRWNCTNSDCKYYCTDNFKFVSKKKRTSNATDVMIVNAFRNLDVTAADVGRQFNVSDHHAIDIFSKYVDMKRLPLSEIISVDEVYLDMDGNCKYVLVLQDFISGEPIDLVKSRRKYVTDPYFMSIPREERYGVKYLISDMYNPYISYTKNIFPNAVPVVDSFHVMQWLIHHLDMYCRKVLKQYKERDLQRARQKNPINFDPNKIPLSNEVYLLQNFRWIILKNQKDIDYNAPKKKNYHYGMMMDVYDYEKRFFALDSNFEPLRNLKEAYVHFNISCGGNPLKAASELDELIESYSDCGYEIFQEFSKTLKSYRQPIINSFIMVERNGTQSRLSNGPMESLNRKAKDLKRYGRGYINFDHLRNRFLFATRKNPHISMK